MWDVKQRCCGGSSDNAAVRSVLILIPLVPPRVHMVVEERAATFLCSTACLMIIADKQCSIK